MGFSDTVRKITCNLYAYHNEETITYTDSNEVKELTLDRNAEGKFFGVSVSQKLNVKLLNRNNDIPLQAGDELKPWFICGNDIKQVGTYYITEIHKDEITNELSITAYDFIYFLTNYKLSDLGNSFDSISAINTAMLTYFDEISTIYTPVDKTAFNYTYSGDSKMNFDGTENLRDILTRICEATQTIAYMYGTSLYYIRLLPGDTEGATIDKAMQLKLTTKENRRLVGIVATTELGENIGVEDVVSGTVQYINENGFLNLMASTDLASRLNSAFALMNGLTINQFELNWRGNATINYGTKLKIEDKQGNYVYSYLLDDTIKYDGSYQQTTKWAYSDSQTTQYNSSSIGDALNRANARVDKVDGRITLEVTDLEGELAEINIQQNSIENRVYNIENAEPDTSAVDQLREDMNNAFDDLSNQYLSKSYTQQIQDAYSWALSVNQEFTNKETLEKGIRTTTALIDEDGITVSKTDSPTTTNINENGMKVMYNETVELEANSQGVTAHNLSADNYLIIDGLIRFEKYKTNRCGCFWIGG